ncbi:MAG: hypothetical protein HZB86_11105 [Deltaproteobacteria bacterium]|nr:hypothetical protein [Deltaproteobacteria bacterium]
MYCTSGALSGVSRKPPPPSSVTPSFPIVFPPVPTALPEVPSCPRPPEGSSRAITIFPSDGVRSRSDRDPSGAGARFAEAAGRAGGAEGGAEGGAGGASFAAGAGNDFSGGRSGFTGRSGTRPSIGCRSGASLRRSGRGAGAGRGRLPSRIPGRGGRKSVDLGMSARSITITSSGRGAAAGRRYASHRTRRCRSTEATVQKRNSRRDGMAYNYSNL